MQRYTVEIVLAIEAMNEESAENKLDTFLSALDLKKNEKVVAEVIGDLSQDGKAVKSSKNEEDDDFDEEDDWDDDWANEDWDSMDEEGEEEDEESDEEPEEADEESDEDELSKLLSSINADSTEEKDEETPTNDEEAEEDWGEWDDESWD